MIPNLGLSFEVEINCELEDITRRRWGWHKEEEKEKWTGEMRILESNDSEGKKKRSERLAICCH